MIPNTMPVSVVMICRTKEDKCLKFPDFKLSDNNLAVCNKVKYLGDFITEQLTSDKDIYRQCCVMCAQANILSPKFNMCPGGVKTRWSLCLEHIVQHPLLYTCGKTTKKQAYRDFK